MLAVDDARTLIASKVVAVDAESVSLADARGRVLRGRISAPEDIPAFDHSAVDGYAITDSDSPSFRLVSEVKAGDIPARRIEHGECARIFTGAALPPGTARVVMQEFATREGEKVAFAPGARGANIRRKGGDARAGTVLLEEGTRTGAVELGLLAQLGVTRLSVAMRPRVVHVATGGELVDPGETPAPGQIRDSNSTLVAALVAGEGGEIVAQRRVGDEVAALLAAVQDVSDPNWHVLLISGGASVGDYDFGRRAIERLGFAVHFHQLNLRPGKPLIFATRGRQVAFVIPGNPLSHFVCWHVAIRAAFDALAKCVDASEFVEVCLGGERPLPGHPRETCWPARLTSRGGQLVALPLRWQSSGDLTGLGGVNALLRVPSNSPAIDPGARLTAFSLRSPA
jgi:molybdopterin molybdotransferase